jgi:hypothetical protein
VGIEPLVGAGLQDFSPVSLEDTEGEQSVDDDADRRVVHLVKGGARLDGRKSRLLRRQDDLVNLFLRRREAAGDRVAARHVGGVQPVFAARVVDDHLLSSAIATSISSRHLA